MTTGRTDLDKSIAMLEDALTRCREEDMRTPEVLAALDLLAGHAKEKWPFDQFRGELDNDGTQGWEIEWRYQVLNASLNGIKLVLMPGTVNRSEWSEKRQEGVFEPPRHPEEKDLARRQAICQSSTDGSLGCGNSWLVHVGRRACTSALASPKAPHIRITAANIPNSGR